MKRLIAIMLAVLVIAMVGCRTETRARKAPIEGPLARAPEAPVTVPAGAGVVEKGVSDVETQMDDLDSLDADLNMSELDSLDMDLQLDVK